MEHSSLNDGTTYANALASGGGMDLSRHLDGQRTVEPFIELEFALFQ